MLTLFAFSQENWQRPAGEIEALMSLLEEYIAQGGERAPRRRASRCGSWATSTGSAPAPARAVDRIMAETAGGTALALNLCISYSSRAEIARAARLLAEEVAGGPARPGGHRRGGRWPPCSTPRPGPIPTC